MEKFPQARYKKFDSELDAKAFVSGFDHPGRAGNTIMSDLAQEVWVTYGDKDKIMAPEAFCFLSIFLTQILSIHIPISNLIDRCENNLNVIIFQYT